MNDHCGFLVDYEIERHFKCGLSEYDKPNHTMLNNEITTNVKRFNEKLDKVMTSYQLKERVIDLKM